MCRTFIEIKPALLFLFSSAFTTFTFAQQDTLDERTLGEVIISANKFAERRRNVNQKVDVITARSIAAANAQNMGDLLVNSGNVFVQKSQQGGSSPVLRGFEASRVLLVIDGIRMNNAIYRAGHLQNIITVDQNMLERVEVLYGPASTLYGSDALGGVIHFRTKSPQFSLTNKIFTTGTAMARYSSANNEKSFHFNSSIGGKRFAWLQSYSYSYFGDMKMGKNDHDDYPFFGIRDSLVSTEGGTDVVIANKDPRVQKFSGYEQWDVTQKFLFRQNNKITHQLNLQHSNSTDIPRYDRLQDNRNFGGTIGTTLRFAEWYYGPQTRYLGSYEMNSSSFGLFDQFRANIHYQYIEESRNQREFQRYDRFDRRKERLTVAGYILDVRKKWSVHELTLGTDGQLNDVKSTASRTDLVSGTVSPLDTRYPDGENKMNYFGLYGQHLVKLANEKVIVNDGLRLQVVTLRSQIINNSFFNLPITKTDQTNFAVTWNLGMVYLPNEDFRVSLGFSSGFRHPNIDDLSRIFESSTSLKRVVIPNPNIKPEYTYNIDLGITQLIADKLKFDITGFYTFFQDAITLAPFQLNGEDSILYNGIYSAVYANRNVKKARTYGFNGNLTLDLDMGLRIYTTATYTMGNYIEPDGTKTPQDHIPPFYGKGSVSYSGKKISTEAFVLFNGWKKIEDYNPDGEDNQQYATPDGMPSWLTLNWRGSIQFIKQLQFQLAVENILDRNYRYFASGISAAGRNFVAALRLNF